MTFSPLQMQILTGAAGDLAGLASETPTPWSDIINVWGRRASDLRLRNDFIAAAVSRRQVPVRAEKWLGRPLTPSDAASFSRAVKTLEAKGLVVRVSDSRNRGGAMHTRNIRFTELGEQIAAELLSNLPASAGNLTPAEPALAASQFWSKELMPTETLRRETGGMPPSFGPAIPSTMAIATPATTCPPVVATASGSVKPRPLAAIEGLSPERLAAEVGYGGALATWVSGSEKLEGLKAYACNGPQTVTVETLRERRDAIQSAELKLAQDAVTLTSDYVGHAEARVPELATVVETRGEEMIEAEAEVIETLRIGGVSVESQKGYPANIEAAKVTFRIQVQGSAVWKAANAKLTSARATHQASVEAVTAGRLQATKAKAYLASVVHRLAAV